LYGISSSEKRKRFRTCLFNRKPLS
jgi:hypothetical protein